MSEDIEKAVDASKNDMEQRIEALETKMNNYEKNFYFLMTPNNNISASSAKAGAIAFICGGSNPHIECASGGEWIPMGAVWK